MIDPSEIQARLDTKAHAVSLRHGDRDHRIWRPEEAELACEVFFGKDWWEDRRVFNRRSEFRTAMVDALNAAWDARAARLSAP